MHKDHDNKPFFAKDWEKYRWVIQGLKKKINSCLPLWTSSSQICLPRASVSLLLIDLIGRPLAWALAHQANKNETLPACKENLLVPDDWTELFLSPVIGQACLIKMVGCCPIVLVDLWTLIVTFESHNIQKRIELDQHPYNVVKQAWSITHIYIYYYI